MDYLLGVDVGNTKTIALVARADGAIVGVGRAGQGDIYGAPSPEAALAAIAAAVGVALAAAGITPAGLAAGAFSVAGADWPEDFAFLRSDFAGHGWGRRIVVVNDAVGALRAGAPDGTGVVVVCGTGAATAARAPDGRLWHSSFWQEPQGGLQLAQKTLRAVYRAALGIDPPTALTPAVLAYFGQPTVEAVLHQRTARPASGLFPGAPDGGGLARVLLDVAAAGDPTARRLVTEHGAALGDYALAAARQVDLGATAFPLVLAGGVFRHPSPLLADALIARVHDQAPGAQPVRSRFEPAVGALFLAWDALGIAVDRPLLARLAATLPPAAFFAT